MESLGEWADGHEDDSGMILLCATQKHNSLYNKIMFFILK